MLSKRACAIFSGSASERTIPGSFPPSSSVTRLSVAAADSNTRFPVNVDPVNHNSYSFIG